MPGNKLESSRIKAAASDSESEAPEQPDESEEGMGESG